MPRSLRALCLVLALLSALCGCGGSGSGSGGGGTSAATTSASTPVPTPVGTAVVTLKFGLETRARVPLDVESYRITGVDAAGAVLYGPVTASKAAVVVLPDVPRTVVTINVVYLVGSTAVGTSSQPVDLSSGAATVDFTSSPFNDLGNLASLSISPTTASIAAGTTQQFQATGRFTDGSNHDLTAAVTWGTSPAAVATIAQSGLATATGIGSTSVTASLRAVTAPPAILQVVATPVVSSVSPLSGPSAGGNSVVITGSAFTGASGVKFGAAPAAFVVDSDTRITAVAPAGSGVVDVTVSAGLFPSARSAADAYTYVAPPSGTTVVPNLGPSAGGTQVTLTGTALAGATSVTVGGAPAIIRGTTATTVLFTTPSGTAGPADIVVSTAGGSVTVPAGFTYVTPPSIATIVPNAGPASGGTSIVITGTELAGTSRVTIGGAPAAITANTAASVTVTSPPGAVGPADVAVTTAGGTSTASGGFTYVAGPVIGGLSPTSGAEAGGTPVTITGTLLAGAASVTFNGTPGTITANTSTSITVTSPAGTGLVDVAVTTAGGTATVFGAYTYVAVPSAGSVSPAQGPTAGGNTLTITGTGLSQASSVTVGGSPATITVNDGTTVQVTAPAGSAGPVDVAVTNAGGTSTIVGGYTYVVAPTVTTVSPAVGSTAGGGPITITGTGLAGVTAVTFAGNPATVTANTATTVTVTAPAGAAGPADVAVTTAGGTATKVGAYTYVDTPAIGQISPNNGVFVGGTSVTITGLHLADASSVTIGGQAATIASNTDTSIDIVTPSGSVGPAPVAVTTAGGSATTIGGFTYTTPAPTVTAVSPTSGTTAGGTSVTISGSGFSSATGVKFQTTAAAFVVVSDTEIAAISPAGTGLVDVFVSGPGGTSTGGTAALYTYVAAPTQTTIVPNQGPAAGGTTVTISGTALAGATSVTFGGTPATITGTTATSVTVTTPAGSQGPCDVAITTSGGSVTETDGFTYLATPGPGPISPNVGPQTGGTTVTITGVNLAGVTAVTLGGAPATILANTPTMVTVTSPPGTVGAADVAVSTAGGTSTLSGAFTYLSPPVVGPISPNSGSSAGGTVVTINGVNLIGVLDVSFGGVSATILANTPTSVTVQTAAGTAGVVDVSVTSVGGTDTARRGYTYVDAPDSASLSATQGPTAGGNSVTISGNHLANASAVTFGGAPATIGINTDTVLIVTVPAGSAGIVDVAVVTAGGTLTLTDAYIYVNPPGTGPISPNRGAVAGGTSVTLTGVNLAGVTSVTFGGVPATINFNTPTMVQVVSPAGAPGPVDVSVTTAGGTSTITNNYTYVSPPSVATVSPNAGPTSGGNAVTITGVNLADVYDVTFGGQSASIGANTPTSITVTVPAGASSGAVDVAVMTPGGTVTITNGYTYADPPTFATISPSSGPITGGTTVTITGSNLTRTTSITFGGTSAAFGVVSDTVVVAITPAGSAGAVDVVITSAGGTATAVGAYTFIP